MMIVVRPNGADLAALAALGDICHIPSHAYQPMPRTLELGNAQAILATSAHIGQYLATHRQDISAPFWVVGQRTAQSIAELGLNIAHVARDGAELAQHINQMLDPSHGPLHWLSGQEYALDFCAQLPAFQVQQHILYAMAPCDGFAQALDEAITANPNATLLIFAPSQARAVADAIAATGADTSRLSLVAISAAAAAPLDANIFAHRQIADAPNMESVARCIAAATQQP